MKGIGVEYTVPFGDSITLLEHVASIQPDEKIGGQPALTIEAVIGYKLVSHSAGEVQMAVSLPDGTKSMSHTRAVVPVIEGLGTVPLTLWMDVVDACSFFSVERVCLHIGLGYWQTDGPYPGFHWIVSQYLDDVCYSLSGEN